MKLVQSIKDFPEMLQMRPIVVNDDMIVLGGNMRLKALQHLKRSEIPDSWVTLADDWTQEQRNEFTIKDNLSFGEWDMKDLSDNWDVDLLEDWGLDIEKESGVHESTIKELFDLQLPIYEPSEIKPNVSDLCNSDKANELIKRIDETNLSEDLKSFLKFRAAFFVNFNFSKIADSEHPKHQEIKP